MSDEATQDEGEVNLAYHAAQLNMLQANEAFNAAQRMERAQMSISKKGHDSDNEDEQPSLVEAYLMAALTGIDYRLQETNSILRTLVALQEKDSPDAMGTQEQAQDLSEQILAARALKLEGTDITHLTNEIQEALEAMFQEAGIQVTREGEEEGADAASEAAPSPS